MAWAASSGSMGPTGSVLACAGRSQSSMSAAPPAPGPEANQTSAGPTPRNSGGPETVESGLADVGGGCCERICERNAAQLPRWGETKRDGWDGRLIVSCAFETREVTWDGDRLAHNPEVAGSNPVPATSGNGPRRRLRGPFSCPLDTYLDTLLGFLVNCRLPSLLDSSILPGVMAFPFFGGASVIVCQGADLIAIRSRRPPKETPQQ